MDLYSQNQKSLATSLDLTPDQPDTLVSSRNLFTHILAFKFPLAFFYINHCRFDNLVIISVVQNQMVLLNFDYYHYLCYYFIIKLTIPTFIKMAFTTAATIKYHHSLAFAYFNLFISFLLSNSAVMNQIL